MIWKRTQVIHGDMLKPCSPEFIGLPEEMERRFLAVCELWGRVSGGAPLPIPAEMERHFLRWRQVLQRYRKGDFRLSASEWSSIKEVAQFIFDWHCRLRGQPLRRLVWSN